MPSGRLKGRKDGKPRKPRKWPTDKERLLSHILKLENGCWEWTGFKNPKGYGRVKLKNKNTLTHRASYTLYIGPIPEGFYICHTCDNRACFNPEHLFLGTQKDNMVDCVNKGRSAKGERSGRVKLTEKQVLEIRQKYATGEYTQRMLYEEYGVSNTNINYILRRRIWKSI